MTNQRKSGRIYVIQHQCWQDDVTALLDAAGLPSLLQGHRQVLIKPNLVEALAPPVTTPVECVASVVAYLQKRVPDMRVVVGEGVGASNEGTMSVFEKLGYGSWAARCGIDLVDLNEASLKRLANPACRRWPEMFLPQIVLDSFLLSIPVLKAHSLAGVTLTMKNMMGCAPPAHFRGGGPWKKSMFHERIHEAILDLNRYRTPDFTLLDATVGMPEAHLWGPSCNPPHRKLVASVDPVALDSYGSGLLQRDWRKIGYLRAAHGELGCADPLDILEVRREGHRVSSTISIPA
jgi:uncharacterized protein (DUF362 family)